MHQTLTRRAFLRVAGGSAIAGGLAGLGLLDTQARATRAASLNPPRVWVWKASADGDLSQIRDNLAAHGLAIILKTHDGTEWMQRFDRTHYAVTGPERVRQLAEWFEQAGVPFHAWCVVQGRDPITEAHMCAEVLAAGPRSLFLDLEPKEGNNYWQGPWQNAIIFGQELRRLRPNDWITLAPDARPWQVGAVPLHEFMSFSNAVAPQSYWETFNGPTNNRYLTEHGYSVGPEGMTPELIVQVGHGTFNQFGVPIQPIGQGASSPDMWRRFIATAGASMSPVSLWRYGTADPAVFAVLGEVAAEQRRRAEAAAAPPAPTATPPPTPTPQPVSQELAHVGPQYADQPATGAAESEIVTSVAKPARVEPALPPPPAQEAPAPPPQKQSLLDSLRLRRGQETWSNRFVDPDEALPNLERLQRLLGK